MNKMSTGKGCMSFLQDVESDQQRNDSEGSEYVYNDSF